MLNRIILIGRLTKDPELRYTPNGTGVATFTLAVDRPFSNNGQKETDFISIVAWRQTAEACANYLRKGRLTAIEGRIQTRNYENNEGKRVYVTEVVADNVRFLEKAETPAEQSSTSTNNPYHTTGGRDRDPFTGDGKPIDISDDDLPF